MPNAPVALLETKLQPPRARPSLLERRRLVSYAPQILEVPLTVVSAPAGFGKSTLLASWYRWLAEHASVAWLSLDEADSDPDHFSRYLAAAVNRSPGDGCDLGEMPLEALVLEIVGRAGERSRPFVLILDDFQLAESPRVAAAIRLLLDHLPADMHLVVGTRRDPQLPLPRLRARGRLLEVRAEDLRFNADEVGELLNGSERLALSTESIATLESRTEGWAAALQLAALSVKGKDDRNQFVQSFSGTHQFVYDYLAEEVFHQQDGDVRAFLLKTAVLDRMSGPLCDFVSGMTRSGSRLEQLNRANLFTVALDEDRAWFRYHRLFRDFLRRRLDVEHPGEAPALHRLASEWFASQNLLDEALSHAVAAGDAAWTLSLIEQSMPAAILRGDILFPAFDAWLQAIDHNEIVRRPRIGIPFALSRALAGRVEETGEILERIEGVLEGRSPSPYSMQAEELSEHRTAVSLARAYLARYQGEPERALAIADRALEVANTELARAWLGVTRQFVLFEAWSAERQPSAGEIRSAARRCYAVGHQGGATAMETIECYRLVLSGELLAADRHVRSALAEAYERKALPVVGMLHGAFAEMRYERGELDEAEDEALSCMEFGAPGASPGLFMPPEATLARIKAANGDFAQAREYIRMLRERAATVETVQGRRFFPALVAHLHLLVGDIASPREWADGLTVPNDSEPTFANEYSWLVYARVLAGTDRLAAAIDLVQRVEKQARMAGRMGRALEAKLIEACCHWRLNDERMALHAFSELLPLAEGQGYARTLLDEGEPALALLRRTASGGRHAAYSTRVLLIAGESARSSARAGAGPDELSERELDVLRLLVLGSSNREIASDLVVSLDTVKTHLRNVYGKLGAHSRSQAIAAAHERKLL
ncbi:MAG: LuxR C-terminal-related transcriptional regulator [Dehalococcoidia bacterium]